MNLLLLTVAARIARRIENDCHQCGVQNSQIVPTSEFDQFEKHPLLRAVSQWLRKATALSINLLAPACRSRRTSRSTLSDCSRAALEAILHTAQRRSRYSIRARKGLYSIQEEDALSASAFPKVGLEAMLTPDNCVLILIDHQPFQVAAVRNIDPQLMINNTVALAKTAKVFNVPTLLTTVIKDRGGDLLKPIQDVFPDQVPIDRTFINTWEDKACVDWVKNTGRKKVVIAALWTEVCLAFPVIQALGEGFEVYFVTDASGGVSVEAHDRAVQRMVQAGGVPLTWMVFASELQRDWARESTASALAGALLDHGGATGTSLAWEWQLLGSRGGG